MWGEPFGPRCISLGDLNHDVQIVRQHRLQHMAVVENPIALQPLIYGREASLYRRPRSLDQPIPCDLKITAISACKLTRHWKRSRRWRVISRTVHNPRHRVNPLTLRAVRRVLSEAFPRQRSRWQGIYSMEFLACPRFTSQSIPD